jgi:hypothetical protein
VYSFVSLLRFDCKQISRESIDLWRIIPLHHGAVEPQPATEGFGGEREVEQKAEATIFKPWKPAQPAKLQSFKPAQPAKIVMQTPKAS